MIRKLVYGIPRNQIIGPIFSDDTTNSNCYCKEIILYPFIGPLNDDEMSRNYFQQDDSTAHTALVSMTLLCNAFRNRKISNDMWPPPSPILTPRDYYCWVKWKPQFTKTVFTIFLNWRKPSQISSGTFLQLNCHFANKVRCVDIVCVCNQVEAISNTGRNLCK
jgi:hypothetical protein